MTSKIYITMTSSEYGKDRFDYFTMADAKAGWERLVRKAKLFAKADSIVRTITLKAHGRIIGSCEIGA
jgi:hypothetical protein